MGNFRYDLMKFHFSSIAIFMTDTSLSSENDLPLWMKQARRGIDWGVLLVLVLSLASAWPFILNAGVPRTNDSERYVFRVTDTAQALREGRLYPRWSPYALQGYGAPIPHYEPPGAPYTAALLSVLVTNDPVRAVRLLYILAFVLAGTSVYALMLHRSGALAGVLSALLYVYSPHVGLTTPHLLGDLPGMVALGLLPTLLWAGERLVWRNQPFDAVLVAFVAAGLLLTHPGYFAAGVALYVLLLLYDAGQSRRYTAVLRGLTCLLLGVLLAAFYWLPALAEQQLVQWQAPPILLPPLQVDVGALLHFPSQVDPAALLPAPAFTLGVVSPLFGLLAAGVLVMQRRFGFCGLMLISALLVVMGLYAAPGAIWLPGAAALCLALGGADVLVGLARFQPRMQRVLFVAGVLLVMLMSYPVWLGPGTYDGWSAPSPQEQLRYEQQGFGVATLPRHADVPMTISPTLEPSRWLLAWQDDEPLNRFGLDNLQRRQATVLETDSHQMRYQLRSSSANQVTLLLAYFEGWRASLGGQSVPITADPLNGLSQLDLSQMARSGELVVSLDATPVRSAGWFLCVMALVVLLIWVWWRVRHIRQPYYDDSRLLSTQETRLLTILMALFALILLVDTPISPNALRAQGQYALREATRLGYRTDTGLEVVAYEVAETVLAAGETTQVTLYWQALRFLPENYRLRVRLHDVATYTTQAVSTLQHPGYYPTRRWLRNRYVEDVHMLHMPDDLAPGRYLLLVEALRCDTPCEDRLRYFDSEGRSLGTLLTLPQIITIRAA